jgi:hypothetical protein
MRSKNVKSADDAPKMKWNSASESEGLPSSGLFWGSKINLLSPMPVNWLPVNRSLLGFGMWLDWWRPMLSVITVSPHRYLPARFLYALNLPAGSRCIFGNASAAGHVTSVVPSVMCLNYSFERVLSSLIFLNTIFSRQRPSMSSSANSHDLIYTMYRTIWIPISPNTNIPLKLNDQIFQPSGTSAFTVPFHHSIGQNARFVTLPLSQCPPSLLTWRFCQSQEF